MMKFKKLDLNDDECIMGKIRDEFETMYSQLQ
jgi:hypothetical protein